MREFAPGTFGHVTAALGLGWTDMSRISGIEHSTILRWAATNQSGKPVALRCDREAVLRLFDEINRIDRSRGGLGCYTMANFGFIWTIGGKNAEPATLTEVGIRIQRLNAGLTRLAHDARAQYRMLAMAGVIARSEADRAAWDIAWQRYCRVTFPNTRCAYKQPPRGVNWYQP